MLIKPTKKDVIWNYIGIIVSMTSNFFLLPFMMHLIDAEHLGLWYVYLSIGGVVTLFDFGFNPTLSRSVAYIWSGAEKLLPEGLGICNRKEPNYQLLAKVLQACKMIYLLISSLALLMLLTLGTLHILQISEKIKDSFLVVSWLTYALAVFLNLYYGYFATLLRGVGAVYECNRIAVFAKIAQIVTSIMLMYCGLGIMAVSFAYLLYGFFVRILSKRAFYNYKNIGERLQKKVIFNFSQIKELFFIIWHNAWRDGLVSLANYCASQASTLIASNYFSLKETGIYSISVQLINAIVTITGALYIAYQPAMQSAYAHNDLKEAKRLMAVAMVTYTSLFWLGVLLLETIGISLLTLVRSDFKYDRWIIMGIALYVFVYRRQSYYASFISNTNRVPYVKAYVFSGTIGVVLAVIFIKFFNMGLWGLILGQFIVQIAYNCWKWPSIVYRMLKTSFIDILQIGIIDLKKNFKLIFIKSQVHRTLRMGN